MRSLKDNLYFGVETLFWQDFVQIARRCISAAALAEVYVTFCSRRSTSNPKGLPWDSCRAPQHLGAPPQSLALFSKPVSGAREAAKSSDNSAGCGDGCSICSGLRNKDPAGVHKKWGVNGERGGLGWPTSAKIKMQSLKYGIAVSRDPCFTNLT